MLAYRGKPHVGGQGVYVREMSKALVELGHTVEVFGGPPYPDLDDKVPLHKFPSLEIFNDHYPGRIPGFWEIKDYPDFVEVCSYLTGNFSEPLSFSMRAFRALKQRSDEFDLVIDNGSLAYGNLKIQKKLGLPILGIIHHPITVDRRLELDNARTFLERLGKRRWYAFTRMQTRVCQKIQRIITVSESSKEDISHDHKVDINKIHVVPIGIDTDFFAPQTDIERIPGRIVSTASADVPLKGLDYLLEAFSRVVKIFPESTLQVIGSSKKGGHTTRKIEDLSIKDKVHFNKDLSFKEVRDLYCSSDIVVIPSLYEGFGFAIGEAMACRVPVITTSGGAIPEVIGNCGITVAPGNSKELEEAMLKLLPDENLKNSLAEKGFNRIIEHLQWKEAAKLMTESYEAEIKRMTD